MKNLGVLFSLLLCFSLFSCSSEGGQGGEEGLGDLILGSWILETYDVSCIDPEEPNEIFVADDDGCVSIEDIRACFAMDIMIDNNAIFYTTIADSSASNNTSYVFDEEKNIITMCDVFDDCIEFVFENEKLWTREEESACTLDITFKKI